MRVIVLNSDFTYINAVSWKRAWKLVDKGKVEVVKYSGKIIKSGSGTQFKIPLVIKLVNFIKQIYKAKVPFNKSNVILRDMKQCQYCGIKETKMTVDHVLPISRGGSNDWFNCVCACKKCNNKKGNKTLSESKMILRRKPAEPKISQFLQIKMKINGFDKIIFD